MATTDLSITIDDGATSVVPGPGETELYTIVVTNSGSDVTGASVSVPVPAGVTNALWDFVGGSGSVSGPLSGTDALATTVDLANGDSVFFLFQVDVDPAATGALVTPATVTPPTGTIDTNTANNTATDSDTLTPQADLSVAMTDGKTTIVPGTSNTYTITVTNNGPSTLSSLTLSDAIPAALLNASFAPSVGAYDAATGVWSGLSLASGQNVSITLTGTINPSATGSLTNTVTVSPPSGTTDTDLTNNSVADTDTLTPQADLSVTGTLVNTATVDPPAGTTDPNTANNAATDTDTIPVADLQVTMTDGATTVVPGTSDTYTIVVTNNGPDTVSSVTLTDAIPAALSNTSFGPSVGAYDVGTGVWSGLNLASGDSVSMTLTGTINPSATGLLTNTVTVAGTTDTNTANNTVADTDTLTPEADLSVTVTDGATTVVPGTSDTYIILVSNAGPSTAVGAAVTDLFPAAITTASWTAVASAGSSVAQASGTGNIATTVTLLPGGTATFIAGGQISPSATGLLTNTATVTPPAGLTDTNTGNNAATDTDTLALPATTDLQVTITDAATTLVPGSVETYTITVSNNGPDTVSSVTLIDAIPADLLNATFGSPSAGSYDPGSGLWSGLSLASGQSVFVTLSGMIGIATGTLSNTVTLSPPAGVTDINPGNNAATDTDTLILFSRPNASPPPGTSANMILRRVDGLYAIYDIGNNATLDAHPLAQAATDWQFAGFNGSDPSDMMLRNSTSGAFQVYDVDNNNITGTAALGAVGLNWQVAGFGNFNSRGETDMMLRDANTGGFEAYDIANNQITGTAFMGTVGLDWQVGGFGNFSSRAGASDMILRNTTTGGLQVYDIANNQITGTAFLGTVGLEWQIVGVGNFSSMPGETDIMMRNTTTGALQVYDIANNQITGTAFLGTVGLEWQFAGVAPIRGPGTSDLVLRNVNTGEFEAYDIANNQITGAASLGHVGLEWQIGGFAADPPTASTGSAGSTSQLVQAMAGFGGPGGAADGSSTPPLGADTSQQTFLTAPHA